MGIFHTIRDNIRTLLDTITRIQVKYSSPTFEFSGFPAAFIVPSGETADYLTTNENIRRYAFKIWVFIEYDQTSKDNAYAELMDCVDDIINEVDKQENPENAGRSLATNIGAGYTMVAVRAAPGRFALDEEVKLLGAEVTVTCDVTVDLTLLT